MNTTKSKDQIAAIMLLKGNKEQQQEALVYAMGLDCDNVNPHVSNTTRLGPRIKASCIDCKHLNSKEWNYMDKQGNHYFCGQCNNAYIGTSNDTPEFCPLLSAELKTVIFGGGRQ